MEQNIDLDNNEYRQVEILLANTRTSVFMTGKAGTGKSTFLRHITATTKKKYVVLAPTGIAAVNAGGQTLHSFFHIPLKPLLPDDAEFSEKRLSERMKFPRRTIKLFRELDLIIIDEISMVRADTIDFIDKLLRHFCPKFRHLPFAGKQLLMVGDVYQLEPVAVASEREILRRTYPNLYFFSAKVFEQLQLMPIELKKVYRQKDASFVELLDRVRDGHPLPSDFEAINSRVKPDLHADGNEMVMTIATRRDIVDQINETRLAELTTEQRQYTAAVEGDFPEKSFPTDRDLIVKVGAQVVFIRNDQERRWVNGTLGRIVELSDDALTVELEDGKRYEVERGMWHNVEYSYNEEKHTVEEIVKGSFVQFPVKLAWALTIHKSQGLTFSRINIDVGEGAFAGGQSYVALSRCTSLEGISMATPMRRGDIYVTSAVRSFARSFNNAGAFYNVLEQARVEQMYVDALVEFGRGNFKTAVDIFCDAAEKQPPKIDTRFRRIITRHLYEAAAPRRENEQLRSRIDSMQKRLNELAIEFATLGEECMAEAWDFSPALSNFDKALSLNPSCYEALIGKARVLILMGERESAVDILSKAAREFKRHEAPLELGTLFLGEGDLGNAMIYLEKAKKIAPKIPAIYDALADACEALDDPAQAERYRAQAKRLRDKS